ncbi:hypothetical protein E3N88_22906 [Mikania micrantha]|uniref:Small-subunit processome Utp12 domain-containing protein n=1 Tax=Mikania micrantha TaxID=192012 RepID=A0A5N6NEF6_9ASTR|nr:hypothetical protein E3N88_22906 [Mikania micrantha]
MFLSLILLLITLFLVIFLLWPNNVDFFTDENTSRGKKRAASDSDSENAGLNHDTGSTGTGTGPGYRDDTGTGNDKTQKFKIRVRLMLFKRVKWVEVIQTVLLNLVEPNIGIQLDNDEPTIGEKLASLNISNNKDEIHEKAKLSPAKPPSADSVHVLLKQALHVDDRSLLLDCLFRQNEKVITNSVSLLNPSDVFKLLEFLISMIHSRWAYLACTLPWLKSLLLQHASSIMSQESSLIALNSLYQLIESRISTFNSAVQLSSCLDLLYTKTVEDGVDEGEEPLEPIIFEDVSDDDQSEEDGDTMETDVEDNEEHEAVSNVSDDDIEGSDGMVDY